MKTWSIGMLAMVGLLVLSGLKGPVARAGILTSVIGPDLRQPSVIVVDNQPVTQNGDFNRTKDFVQYFFTGPNLTIGGTAITSPAAALPAIGVTGPPALPPPSLFDPTGGFSSDGYFYGFGGGDEIMVADTWSSFPQGIYAHTIGINGWVYFPNPGNAYVNFDLIWTVEKVTTNLYFNVLQPPGGGPVQLGPRQAVTVAQNGGATTPAGLFTIKVTEFNGAAAVYLPASARASMVPTIPEPTSLINAALGLLGFMGYGRLRRRRKSGAP